MRKMSLGIAVLFLLQVGASAPANPSAPKPLSPASSKSKKPSNLSAMSTPQSVGDEIAQYFGRKTGKELMAEKSGASSKKDKKPDLRSAASVKKESEAKKPSAGGAASTSGTRSVKLGYVPPPPVVKPFVPQIRQEIQRILDLNKQIQGLQGKRTEQIQKVQEQARIHQKILTDLAPAKKTPGKTSILAQEKLRIIHETTQRNAQMVGAIAKAPSTQGVPATQTFEKVKPAVS